jgi:hypothetical protein
VIILSNIKYWNITMEVLIPLLAMSGLYIASKQKKNDFEPMTASLPNTDIPDRNYPSQYENGETDITAKLSTDNKYDGTGAYTDKYFDRNRQAPTDSAQAQYRSITGEKVSSDYFKHNNMVPFFGGNIRSRPVDNIGESVLDNYVGSGSQHVSKSERAPLFTPDENSQWAHGAPNSTDFMRSRVNASNKISNVNPFESQRVAPGIGLGYTTGGSGGFNSGMENREAWGERTVDQLRVATNPKASGNMILGYEGAANSHIKQMGTLGIQEKNRVERAHEMGENRLMTTTGIEKGATLRPLPIERETARPETSMEYVGVAGYGTSSAYTEGEYMPSHRNELGAVPLSVANANGRARATESDYGIRSVSAYPNNRSEAPKDDYFGAIGGAFGAAVAPLLDILRPTRKEDTVRNLRLYQNAKPAVGGSYVYDANDKPLPTIREMTENSKNHANINAGQNGGGYIVSEHQMAETARANTGDFYYAGGSSAKGGSQNSRTYDAEYNQRNNDLKSSTIAGRMSVGNLKMGSSDAGMAAKIKDMAHFNDRAPIIKGAGETPHAGLMGRMTGAEPLKQMDRNAPELMNALKTNPYVLPYTGK